MMANKEEKPQDMERRKTIEWCKYIFSEKELKEIARELAQAMEDLNRKKDGLKAVSSTIRGEIAELEARTKKDARLINTGYEMREIDCEEEKDYRAGRVIVTRMDTLEVVKERAMRADERQPPLSLNPELNPA